MTNKRQDEQKIKEQERFTVWPILVGLPGPEGDDGDRPVAEYATVAIARTFNIARYLAYSIAMRGVPTSWPKEANQQNLPNRAGWFTSSVNKAQNMGRVLSDAVQNGAIQDRGILAAREMRARGRLGPVIGELRDMGREAENPSFVAYMNTAASVLGAALATPVMPRQETNYGVEWVKGHSDILNAASDAWGVDRIDMNACAVCGQDHHNAPHGGEEINVEELMGRLQEAFGAGDEAQGPEVPAAAAQA
jgi:hypothetical protein